ncbi:PAS domain-containing sensor histidine kinase [Rufibacter quisquiliarum]|uniref:Oxygen sensor histidine kinase NreB n=1 Tax=Rufibacter quisquiliarum TaxID=1549639 RepID=A0A839GWN2_9BACT|nr:PAS domain S-box protein [Rufibacter quisquiliarum]MBA9079156.1 PAS domain S-box-containing protein [Rufibacter quisquiliarum]
MQAHQNSKLRERAEKLQRLVTVEEAEKMSPEEVRNLIQQLQIYQIELEMQNHQLELNAAELEQARNKYQDLYDTAPFGYLTLDEHGVIVEANRSAARLLQHPRMELYDIGFSFFIHPNSIADFYSLFRKLKDGTQPQRAELELFPPKGDRICAQIEAVQLPQQGAAPLFRLVFLDVTERKKAEVALKKSEQLLNGIINSAINGIQVFKAIRNRQGQIEDFKWLLLNHAAEEFMHTSFAQLSQTTMAQESPEEITSGRFIRYAQVVETGETQTFTAHFKKAEREYWLNLVAVKMDDGFVLTFEDITEQHVAHEQLKENQHFVKAVAEAVPDFIYVDDLEAGHTIYSNHFFLQKLGFTPAEVTSRTREIFLSRLHPDDKDNFLARKHHFAQMADGKFLELKFRAEAKNGSWKTFFIRETIFKRNKDGQPLQVVGVSQDITEQLRAEQELRQMHETVTSILENLPITLWRFAKDGQVLESRGSGLKALGLKENQLIGQTFAAVHKELDSQIKDTLQGNKISTLAEFEIDNEKIFKQVYLFQDSNSGEAIGFCLDVTEQKRVEAEVQWRNFILDQLIQKLPLILGILNKDGTYLELRGKGLRRLGIADNELVGHNLFEFFPQLENSLEEILTGEAVNFIERKEFNGLYAYYQNFGLFDPKREYGIAFAIDITELIETQENLLNQKEFSENLLENSIDGIMAFDQNLCVTSWNKTMEQVLQVSKEHVLDKPLPLLFAKKHQTYVQQQAERVLRGEHLTTYEIPGLETERVFEVNLVPFTNAAKEVAGALGIVHDITQQRQRQAEETRFKLSQQKGIMDAVLTTQNEERKRIAEALHNSLAQLLYAAKLNLEDIQLEGNVQKEALLPLQKVSRFLEEAIKETRTLAHELIPRVLQDFGLKSALKDLATRLTTGSFTVQCVVTGFDQPVDHTLETHLFRFVQELLNNVMKHAEATSALVQVVDKGPTIRIRVVDDGKGMPAEWQTKNLKGMGIATLRDRVKLLQGTIKIDSAPGEGTTVTIDLPH